MNDLFLCLHYRHGFHAIQMQLIAQPTQFHTLADLRGNGCGAVMVQLVAGIVRGIILIFGRLGVVLCSISAGICGIQHRQQGVDVRLGRAIFHSITAGGNVCQHVRLRRVVTFALVLGGLISGVTSRRVVFIVSGSTVGGRDIGFECCFKACRVKGRSRRRSTGSLAIIGSGLCGFHSSIIVLRGVVHLLVLVHRGCTSIVILAVHVQACIITCAGDSDQRKVIHTDIGLDCIIRLSIPFSGFHDKILIVPDRQFPQTRCLYGIRIINYDFCSDGFSVLLSGGQDCAHTFPVGIVLVDHLRIVGNNDRLSLIACKAFGVKHIFRPAQFPALGTIFQMVHKDACTGQDGVIIKISLGAVMLIDRYTVGSHFAPKD